MSGGGKQKQTQQELELSKRGANEWNRRVTAFLPVEDQFLKNTKAKDTDRAAIAGQTDAAAAQGGAGQLQGLATAMASNGRSMSDGMGIQAIGGQGRAFAGATGEGRAAGDQALMRREVQGKLSAVSSGRGLSALSSAGMQGAASTAAAAAKSRADNNAGNFQSVMSGLASGAGMYAAYKTPKPAAGG